MSKKLILSLLVLSVLVIGSAVWIRSRSDALNATLSRTPGPSNLTVDGTEFLNLLNQERQSKGLGVLQTNDSLCKIATARAEELVDNHQESSINESYNHSGLTKYDSWYSGTWQEDTGTFLVGRLSTEQMLESFLNSPPHQKSLDNPSYTQGCAITNSDIIDVIVGTAVVSPVATTQPASSNDLMVCYPAPQQGTLHPLFCGTPNMSTPYWCNLLVYPATTNPSNAVCGYQNQPNSVRQCWFNAITPYVPGGPVGYAGCR